MGNDQSKWSDFTKEEKILIAKDYAQNVKTVCDQFVARLEAGDIEDLMEPEYAISRFFTWGNKQPNSEFSFKIEFGMKGDVKKTIKQEEFWPKDTITGELKHDSSQEDAVTSTTEEDEEDEEDKDDAGNKEDKDDKDDDLTNTVN